MDLRVGRNYQLVKKIGSGAFGEIYEGKSKQNTIEIEPLKIWLFFKKFNGHLRRERVLSALWPLHIKDDEYMWGSFYTSYIRAH